MKKLRVIRRLILILIVLSLIVTGVYTYFISPTDYCFKNEVFTHKNISSQLNGFKIAFISDINLTNQDDISRLNTIIDNLNEYAFDMLIFGGDLYEEKVFNTKDVAAILKKIHCKYGKFAILGEKDEKSSIEIQQILNNGGFEVLNNETRTLYYKETSFELIAASDDYDVSKIKQNAKLVTIGVCHQPDSFTKNKDYVDLQLSGHSYGGSLYIPLLGPLSTMEGAQIYNHGIYEEKKSSLIVSNGLSGPSSFPYKLFARNQILFVTLKSKQFYSMNCLFCSIF